MQCDLFSGGQLCPSDWPNWPTE